MHPNSQKQNWVSWGLAYEHLIHDLFTISKDASRELLMMDTPISF